VIAGNNISEGHAIAAWPFDFYFKDLDSGPEAGFS